MNFYVIATYIPSGKIVALAGGKTQEEAQENIDKYSKMDNKHEELWTYEIVSPITK